jgi:hypothetical protein
LYIVAQTLNFLTSTENCIHPNLGRKELVNKKRAQPHINVTGRPLVGEGLPFFLSSFLMSSLRWRGGSVILNAEYGPLRPTLTPVVFLAPVKGTWSCVSGGPHEKWSIFVLDSVTPSIYGFHH